MLILQRTNKCKCKNGELSQQVYGQNKNKAGAVLKGKFKCEIAEEKKNPQWGNGVNVKWRWRTCQVSCVSQSISDQG